MRKTGVALGTAGLAALTLGLAALTLGLAAPAAHAEDPLALGGIAGFSANQTEMCGASSITPVLVSNYTNHDQTGTITVNSALSLEVGVFTSLADAMASPWGSANSGFCVDEAGFSARSEQAAINHSFTIPAGGESLYYLGIGGMSQNIASYPHDIAINGMPGGVWPVQWYNFQVDLNADQSFQNLLPTYSGTGGIDPATNIQGATEEGGFNITLCNVQGSTLYNTTKIISPYSANNNLPAMTQNQPLCMAWFPEGQFLNNTSFSGSLISTVKATQYNPTSNSLSVAGSFATSDPVSAFNYISYGVTTPIPTSANSNTGTFYQNGSDFIVENLPVGCNNMVLQFTSSAYGPASLSTVVPYNKSCNSNNIYR